MGPIRVGLIGLAGTPPDKYEGTHWTSSAHLPFLERSVDFEIVALLNTSTSTAKAAVERHKLPLSTKTYSNPEDLAADRDIDLVVCSVRVDRHFQTVRPSIIAGKTVYVEWPLERNLEIAQEMAELARKHNARTIVGLQGSYSPAVRSLKQAIHSGKIGKVLSSSVIMHAGNLGALESKNIRYFLDRNVGGSIMSIHLGHSLEFMTSVLGEIQNFDSLIAIRRKTIDIIDKSNGNRIVDKAATNTSPDQIMYQGTVADGALLSVVLHGGSPFPGVPAIDWRVIGESGQLRITSPSSGLNVGHQETKVEWNQTGSSKVETLVDEVDEWSDLPLPAQNIARLYEAYRKNEFFPDFDWALKRHTMIETMWRRFNKTE